LLPIPKLTIEIHLSEQQIHRYASAASSMPIKQLQPARRKKELNFLNETIQPPHELLLSLGE
jgi:hypothetical protein